MRIPSYWQLLLLCPLVLAVWGCSSLTQPTDRTSEETTMFGPARMRIHPIFTQVKNFSGDSTKPDGIEAELEFEDQFGDPTKAAGTVRFELFSHAHNDPDPRCDRLHQWSGALLTLEQQQLRWNRTSRTYSFQLAAPSISLYRTYVLTAMFEKEGGGRFFSRVILQGLPTEKPPIGMPPTRPAVGSATQESPGGASASRPAHGAATPTSQP